MSGVVHVVGAGGFIGQAIQREAGASDRFCYWSSAADALHHFDLLDVASWAPLLQANPATVVLLSWPGLPNYQQPYHLTRNLPAALQLIGALAAAGLQRLVVAGTCYEYGLQTGCLQEAMEAKPCNPYAVAKDSLRRALESAAEPLGLSWAWLRIFYPYGEGQSSRSLLPSLKRAVEAGDRTFPMGSGRQVRDFVPVDLIARQLIALSECSDAMGIFNGCSGEPQTVLCFVQQNLDEWQAKIHLQLGAFSDRQDEPLEFWGDCTRIRALL